MILFKFEVNKLLKIENSWLLPRVYVFIFKCSMHGSKVSNDLRLHKNKLIQCIKLYTKKFFFLNENNIFAYGLLLL